MFTVTKKTGTYADALEAIGIGSLLEEAGYGQVEISDRGMEFVITANTPPEGAWPRFSAGYPYIWERRKEPEKPAAAWVIDYEREREKRQARQTWEKGRKKKRDAGMAQLEEQGLEAPPEAHPSLTTAVIISSMRKGWNGDRELAKWIEANTDDTREWVRWKLGMRELKPENIPEISNTQVLNPISGKGVNVPKTRLGSPGSIPEQLIDPFSEWMKLRGLWSGMLMYRSGEDFKFFALEPASVSVNGLKQIRETMISLNLWGGVRLDIEATLECTRALIKHSDAWAEGEQAWCKLLRRRPRDVIVGLRQAYFKSLGTAAALMNDALMPMPQWFSIESKQDADDYIEIIDEAIGWRGDSERKAGCLGSLQEQNSDDGRILQQFRQWLLTGDLHELLEFHAQFAAHQMQRLARKEWVKGFSTLTLEKLVVKSYKEKYPVRDIIEDEGFRNVARALRNTTVYAVSLRDSKREVQFGLAQRWKQKMRAGTGPFLAEVGEFVQAQNWEVVHRLGGRGFQVSTTDLDRLVELVDKHGAELVGSLLLAYGYARAPKADAEETAPAA